MFIVLEREAKYGYSGYEDIDNDDGDDDEEGNTEDDGGAFGGGFGELDDFDDSFDDEYEENEDDGKGIDEEEFDADDYFSMDCYDVEDDECGGDSAGGSNNPIDKIDVTAFLKKVFQSMSGDVYAQGVIFLSPEQKCKITNILNY